MLAVAVNKADLLGERRRQASDRGKALAGRCTLNRLELTGADEQERQEDMATRRRCLRDSAPDRARSGCDRRIHGQPGGSTATTVFPLNLLGGASAVRPVAISMGPRDRWRNWNGFGRIRQKVIRADSGFCPCSAGVKTITVMGLASSQRAPKR